MYNQKNLLSNTFMHKNNIKTPKIHEARASDLKKPKKCVLWKKHASGALRPVP
ncbi:hypothetical protein Hanom_Chr12g01148841 [Helianthus anomalus]